MDIRTGALVVSSLFALFLACNAFLFDDSDDVLRCLDNSNICTGHYKYCELSFPGSVLYGRCVSSCKDDDDDDDEALVSRDLDDHPKLYTCHGLPGYRCCCKNQNCINNVLKAAGSPQALSTPVMCPVCHNGYCLEPQPCYYYCRIQSYRGNPDSHASITSTCMPNPCSVNNHTACCQSYACVEEAQRKFSYHQTHVPLGGSSLKCRECDDLLTNQCKDETPCTDVCMVRYRFGRLSTSCKDKDLCEVINQIDRMNGAGFNTTCCNSSACFSDALNRAVYSFHLTPPTVCADNDPEGYCRVGKTRICTARDFLGMQFAYNVCPRTCTLCKGLEYGECPTCSEEKNMTVCRQNLTACQSKHVGCYMTLTSQGIQAGCADSYQFCEDRNHFLCEFRPLPFSHSPSLLCNFCCKDKDKTCFENLSQQNLFGNSPT